MQVLEIILSPIVWLMELILTFYISLFSSTGVSILFLSFTFSLALFPLQKIAGLIERRVGKKMEFVDRELQAKRGNLKGEDLFLLTEQIYKQNNYHPIQSVAMGASFFVMLPVLISAILLFSNSEILVEKSFLFIADLSEPDGLIAPINVLPLVMSLVTVVDAKMRFKDDNKSQRRFLIISIVLLVIVYNLASGLVLYWTGSNIMSLIISRMKSA